VRLALRSRACRPEYGEEHRDSGDDRQDFVSPAYNFCHVITPSRDTDRWPSVVRSLAALPFRTRYGALFNQNPLTFER
jgi:hypothetical protein